MEKIEGDKTLLGRLIKHCVQSSGITNGRSMIWNIKQNNKNSNPTLLANLFLKYWDVSLSFFTWSTHLEVNCQRSPKISGMFILIYVGCT